MLGLRAVDPEIRRNFFELYHDSLGKTLFIRLQYIIQGQDWEAVGDVFWLKQALDLLLAILVENERITLAPNSARLPSLMGSGSLPSGMHFPISDAADDSETPLSFEALVSKHTRFMNEMNMLQVINALQLLVTLNIKVAFFLVYSFNSE